MSAQANAPFGWETVAIPISKGLDLRSPDRLVDSSEFLALENARFLRSIGLTRRRGHEEATPRFLDLSALGTAASTLPTTGHGARDPYDPAVSLPAEWCWGYGVLPNSGIDPIGPANFMSTTREPGVLVGTAQRGDEVVAWDGFRLFTRRTDGWFPVGFDTPTASGMYTDRTTSDAVMPWARPTGTPGSTTSVQIAPSVADNGVVQVHAWVTGETGGVARCHILDANGAVIQSDVLLDTTTADVRVVKVFPMSGYIHALVRDFTTTGLYLFTLAPAVSGAVPAWTRQNLGACLCFDHRKISETSFVLMITTAAGEMQITYYNEAAVGQTSPSPAGTVLARGAAPIAAQAALGVHPVTGAICAAWRNGTNLYVRPYTPAGVPLATETSQGGVISVAGHVTLDARYVRTTVAGTNTEVWDIFTYDDANSRTNAGYAYYSAGATTVNFTRTGPGQLASQAFRAGHRVFAIMFNGELNTPVDALYRYFIVDDQLLPVGLLLNGEGFIFSGTTDDPSMLTSVNWRDTGSLPQKDHLVFHCGLMAKLPLVGITDSRAPASRRVDFDFLPPLRSAQLGESTYFAGAQLWSYDGVTVGDAVPAPRPFAALTPSTGAGSLTLTGVYRWRAYLSWANARGEIVRGPGMNLGPVTLAGTEDTVTLDFEQLPTRRKNAVILLYRTQAGGTQYNLVGVIGAGAALAPTVVDTLSDAYISTADLDPFNDASLLPDFPPPSCEVLTASRDRLWIAGGGIAPGMALASKLHQEGVTPAFSPALQSVVSRSRSPLTAVGFVGGTTVLFTDSRCYTVNGDGPSDNLTTGGWTEPELAFADEGCVSQESLALLAEGLIFQSRNGVRMLAPGGGLVDIGSPVDTAARDLRMVGTVVSEDEARLYARDGTALVFNRLLRVWSTWSGLECAGVSDLTTQRALLVRPAGTVLTESDSTFLDGATPFQFRVRTAWLRAKNLGDFQRVRRVGATGVWQGDHQITVRVYMDEESSIVDEWTWSPVAAPTWGSGTWGSGTWGSSGASAWRWRRRPSRQKCSVFSLEIMDDSPDSAGFALTALVLELGARGGLFRLPWQSGQ